VRLCQRHNFFQTFRSHRRSAWAPNHLIHGLPSTSRCHNRRGHLEAACQGFGKTLGSVSLRIYLTGRLEVGQNGVALNARRLPGRQGRRLLGYLVLERARPVPHDELAEAIWLADPPPAEDAALSALVSKLRGWLRDIRPVGAAAVERAFGCYQLHLPADAWVDVEAAGQAVDEAEGALRAGVHSSAWGPACVAWSITQRPILPGEVGPWIERQRDRIRALRVRTLDCLSALWLANGEGALAVQSLVEAVELDPFRETGYQNLMLAHASLGNRAESLRVYERLRRLLGEELGTDPSPQTEAVFLDLLRQ
jgi:SARP family transcriptional regulator, regulator of embCAB operon